MSNFFSRKASGDKKKQGSGHPSQHPQAVPDSPSAWTEGNVILDDYRIERELGCGGMGRVWLVTSQSTGRRFAVKQALIRDEKNRKEFLDELQTWIDLPGTEYRSLPILPHGWGRDRHFYRLH